MQARVALLVAAWTLAAGLFRATPPPAAAGEPPSFEAQATLLPDAATVGDRLVLTVTVRHPADAALTLPSNDTDFAPFMLVAAPSVETRLEGDGGVTTAIYELALFDTGAFELPGLTVEVRTATERRSLSLPRLSARIEATAPPSATLEDLRPPAGPEAFGHGQPGWWQPAVAFLILSGLGVAVFFLMRAALATRPLVRPSTAERPEAVALRRLDAVRASADGAATGTYEALATIIRVYLEQRFALPVTALTAAEARAVLLRAGVDAWPVRLITDLLRQCDAVRYAGYRPAPARQAGDLAVAYEIVALTTPRAPEREREGAA